MKKKDKKTDTPSSEQEEILEKEQPAPEEEEPITEENTEQSSKKKKKSKKTANKKSTPQKPQEEITPLNSEQEKILEWLKKVRFRKNTFGGVIEADVWKKIAELNSMYNAALTAERVRYETLLEQQNVSFNTKKDNGGA